MRVRGTPDLELIRLDRWRQRVNRHHTKPIHWPRHPLMPLGSMAEWKEYPATSAMLIERSVPAMTDLPASKKDIDRGRFHYERAAMRLPLSISLPTALYFSLHRRSRHTYHPTHARDLFQPDARDVLPDLTGDT
jgi:hypothetical protein